MINTFTKVTTENLATSSKEVSFFIFISYFTIDSMPATIVFARDAETITLKTQNPRNSPTFISFLNCIFASMSIIYTVVGIFLVSLTRLRILSILKSSIIMVITPSERTPSLRRRCFCLFCCLINCS